MLALVHALVPGDDGHVVGPGLVNGADESGDTVGDARMADPVTPRSEAVAALAKAGQDGYDAYPRDCSHSIWTMLKLMGSPDEPYRTANELMRYVASQGSGWHRVLTVEDASNLANQGKVVLGGLAVLGGHGHVVMVMPGPWHASGGYDTGRARSRRTTAPPAVRVGRIRLVARRAQPRREDGP